MSRLFLPPRVARELIEETRRFAADVTSACHKDRICLEWDRELKRLDPLLEMVRAPEQQIIGTPLVPGHYHLIRRNQGAPVSVTPVSGPGGEFVEPPGRLLEQIKSTDLWDVNVTRMRERIRDAEESRRERQKEANRTDRQERIVDHFKAVTQASVSMNRDAPWHQNMAGRRGVKKAS